MNKLLKTTLITAVLSTGAMATTAENDPLVINGNVSMDGGEFQISKNDYKLTGSIDFMHEGGKLTVDASRTLEVSGGHIMSGAAGMGGSPEIVLNGTLKITKGESGNMPDLMMDRIRVYSDTSEIVDAFNYIEDGTTYIVTIPEEGTSIKSGFFVATKYNTKQTAEGSDESTDITVILESDENIAWFKKGKIAESDVSENAAGYNGSINYMTQVSSENKEQLIDIKSGTDEGYDYYEKVDLSKFAKNGGLIDMSTLREYTGELEEDIAEPTNANVNWLKPTILGNVKMPFNCRFSGCDFSNVDRVEYTKLTVGESSAPGLETAKDNSDQERGFSYIKKIVLKEGQVYGDYLTNSELGVTLTEKNAEITEMNVGGDVTPLELEKLQKDNYEIKTGEGEEETEIKFNEASTKNRLWTDDLTATTQAITEDTTYNFGFSGTKAVNISGGGKAIFKGNNSEYAPTEKMGVPEEVEFSGDNTLFQFSQNYGHGVFIIPDGSSWSTNEVPEGATITLSKGFELIGNTSLQIRGKLIG